MNIKGTNYLKNGSYNKIILTDFKGLHCNVSSKYEEFLSPEVDISDLYDTKNDNIFLYQIVKKFLISGKITKVLQEKMDSSKLYSFIVELENNKSLILSFDPNDLKYQDIVRLIMDKYFEDRNSIIMGNDYDNINVNFSFEEYSYSLNEKDLFLVLNYKEKDFAIDFINFAVSRNKKALFFESCFKNQNEKNNKVMIRKEEK